MTLEEKILQLELFRQALFKLAISADNAIHNYDMQESDKFELDLQFINEALRELNEIGKLLREADRKVLRYD